MYQLIPPELLSFLKNLTTEEKIKACLVADGGNESAINQLADSSIWEVVDPYDFIKDVVLEIVNEPIQ